MNTRISYMYRDAANYKIHLEEVIAGEMTQEMQDRFFEKYDELDPFYPANLGFKADTFVTRGYAPYDDDPDCHEIEGFDLVRAKPTVNMTVEEFLAAFESGLATTVPLA